MKDLYCYIDKIKYILLKNTNKKRHNEYKIIYNVLNNACTRLLTVKIQVSRYKHLLHESLE